MDGIVLILTYVIISSIGLSAAVGIGLVTDQINVHVSMPVFFATAAAAVAAAWPLALRLTEPSRVAKKALAATSRTGK
jgi:hypothetical protein